MYWYRWNSSQSMEPLIWSCLAFFDWASTASRQSVTVGLNPSKVKSKAGLQSANKYRGINAAQCFQAHDGKLLHLGAIHYIADLDVFNRSRGRQHDCNLLHKKSLPSNGILNYFSLSNPKPWILQIKNFCFLYKSLKLFCISYNKQVIIVYRY